jgi:hypothetical protein
MAINEELVTYKKSHNQVTGAFGLKLYLACMITDIAMSHVTVSLEDLG